MKMNFIFILLFFFPELHAQGKDPLLKDEALELSKLSSTIRESVEYEIRKKTNEEFLDLLQAFLETEEGYEYPLKEINTISILNSEDGEFRLCTWLMRDSLYKYQSFGLVAAKTRKGIVVTRLNDNGKNISQAEFKVLKPNNWLGAIYYEIIPVRKKRKTIYTILGYAPNEPVQRKIVDVISISRKGVPEFGAKIFYVEDFQDQKFRNPPMRLILSYSSDYSASVKWNKKEEVIVMDHLSPPDAKLKRLYRTYGPDMSYDALEWKDGWWHLIVNAKFNSGQNVEIRPPDRPVGPPPRSR